MAEPKRLPTPPPDDKQPEVPVRRDGLGYSWEPGDGSVHMRVDFLKREGMDLKGEIRVVAMRYDPPRHLHQANLNLSSTTARNTLAKHLSGVTPTADGKSSLYPWGQLIEQFCVGVLEATRRGDAFITLADFADEVQSSDLIEKIQPFGAATMVYATGGTGKGWYATRLAVSAATGIPMGDFKVARPVNVLYLDWEDRPQVIKNRLSMVCRGLEIPVPANIRYRRCRGPLAHQIHQIAAEITASKTGLLIVDSVEKASGSSADSQTYQDKAGQLFDALDLLGDLSILLIDHTSAASNTKENKNQVNKAYGSMFKTNWARLAFEMRNHQEYDSSVSHVALHTFKTNHGPKPRPIGFRYDWSQPGRFILTSFDVEDSPELMAASTNEEKCCLALKKGPHSNKELAEAAGISEAVCRTTCNRSKRISRLPGGAWVLAEAPKPTPATVTPIRPIFNADGIEELRF